MRKIDVDELFAGKQSKYALVVGISKRARQITRDYEKRGLILEEKPVLMAVEEVESHKIDLLESEYD